MADERMKEIKLEIAESQLTPLVNMALSAFAKSLIAERDGDATGSTRWLNTALKQEAKHEAK
tara:strand:- start:170 stop:355 length:186 start_codon:yes stop_codon:yes gene_type:complete